MSKALGMAVSASEDIKLGFANARIDGVHVVANAGGWGNLVNAHPHVGIFLPEGLSYEAASEVISEIAQRAEASGVSVSMYTHEMFTRK